MNANVIQAIGIESFQFTVGVNDITSIRVDHHEKDFIVFSVLFEETEALWRHFTYSGSYLVEWVLE